MRTDIVRDHDYKATKQEILWLEKLGRIADRALGCGEDLVAPVIVFQQASLAAVDVTWGVATHADLREAAQQALDGLDDFVNVEPMRRVLREVIAEIDAGAGEAGARAGGDPLAALSEAENALADGADPPRKERAG